MKKIGRLKLRYGSQLWITLLCLSTVVRGGTLSVVAPSSATIDVRYTADKSYIEVVQDGLVTSSNLASSISSIDYTGTTGNDIFINHTDIDSTMSGSGGADILVGGSGSDTIHGGDGDDIIIGGLAADTLLGESNNDLIIHGTTVYDARPDDLLAIQSVWINSSLTYSEKVDGLTLGTNGVVLSYNAQTIMNDKADDTLTGGSGTADLFFARDDDTVTDQGGSEEVYEMVGIASPTTGTSLYDSGWSQGLSLGGGQSDFGSISSITVSGMPFTEAFRATSVAETNSATKDTRVTIQSDQNISNGDQLFLSFYYRASVADTNETALLHMEWTEKDSGNKIVPNINLNPEDDWKQYVEVVTATNSGPASLRLEFGSVSQTIEIGGLKVISASSGGFSVADYSVPKAVRFPQQVPMMSTFSVPVLRNASDSDGESLHITTLVSLPEHGTAHIDASGTNVVYTSTEEFFGVEEFKYALADAVGNTTVADIQLLVRHNVMDGTWQVGNDPAFRPADEDERLQFFSISDPDYTPYGYFKMGRAMGSGQALTMDSHTDANTECHYLIFGKKNPDGSNRFPCGWMWSLPDYLEGGNYMWSGVSIGGSHSNHYGIYREDIVDWKINLDVENHNLGFRRGILINTYWYLDPEGKNAADPVKTMDLGLFFMSEEMLAEKVAESTMTNVVIDGRSVYFSPGNASSPEKERFYMSVPDYDRFSLTDFDMAPYLRFLFDEGEQLTNGYFWGGAFDVELKHRDTSDPSIKTTGEYYVRNFDWMIHLDMTSDNPIQDRTVSNSEEVVSMANVFAHRGGDHLIPNGQGGLQTEPVELEYTIVSNSNPSLVGTSVNGSDLILNIASGVTGTASLTVRGTDRLNRWYDDESFTVNVPNAVTNIPLVFKSDPLIKSGVHGGVLFSGSLSEDVSGSASSLVFTKLSGPAWLTVDSDGTLSGTPTTADFGLNKFRVQVTNPGGESDTATLKIFVTTALPDEQFTFNVTDDTYVRKKKASTNYGDETSLRFRYSEASDGGDKTPYLKFNVNGSSDGAIKQATLYVRSLTCTTMVDVCAVSDTTWSEDTLTANNAPDLGATIASAQAASDTWISFDLNNYIPSNGTYSVALDEATDSGSDSTLGSKEGGFGAYLEVIYSKDFDSDGLPDSWEYRYGSSLTNFSEYNNRDGDIHTDYEEYITGMDPTNAASFLHLTQFEPEDGTGVVIEWNAVSNRLYRVSWSSGVTNTFTFFPGDIEYPQSSYTDTVHQVDDQCFYKIDVRLKE